MAVNSQKRRRGLIAIVAAVIAAGAFVFALSLNNSGSPVSTNPGATAAPAPTAAVVVAIAEIKPGDPLSATNVAVQQRRADSLPATPAGGAPVYYSEVAPLVSSPHYAAIALASGTVIQTSMVAASAGAAKPSVSNVIDIKDGDVAMSIPYAADIGAGGYIQPEDHIDILMLAGNTDDTHPGTLYFAFQDVRVIRVGGPGDATGGGASLLLIELPRQQAGDLSYDMAHKVTFRLLLRPRSQYGKGKLPGSDQVNGTNWPTFLDG